MTDNTWPTVDTELIDDVTLYSAKLIIPVTGPVIIAQLPYMATAWFM